MDIAVFSSYLDNISVDVCSNEFCEYLPKCGAPEFLRLNQSFHYRDYISRNPAYCQWLCRVLYRTPGLFLAMTAQRPFLTECLPEFEVCSAVVFLQEDAEARCSYVNSWQLSVGTGSCTDYIAFLQIDSATCILWSFGLHTLESHNGHNLFLKVRRSHISK